MCGASLEFKSVVVVRCYSPTAALCSCEGCVLDEAEVVCVFLVLKSSL